MTTKKSAGAQPATAEQPMDVMAKCQAMYDKGMGEDQIIEALAKHEGLSIMRAVTTYKKFLKDAGLTMSKEERVQLISDTIAKFVDEKAKTVELDKAVAAVAVELGISDQAAKGHVARYCKGKGIALPVRQTMSEEDLKPYVDTVVKGREAGDTRAKTVAGMVKQFKLDEKLANRIYYRVCKLKGLTESRETVPQAELIAFLKQNGATLVDKQKFVAALCKKFPALSNGTAGHYWRTYNFALEFSKA